MKTTRFNYEYLRLLIILPLFMWNCQKDGGVIERKLTIKIINLNIPTTYNLVKMQVITPKIIYVFAHNNDDNAVLLYRSSDGGQTWTDIVLPVNTAENIQDLVFLDIKYGAILLDKLLYHTQNGGASWTLVQDFVHPVITCGIVPVKNNGYYFFENSIQIKGDVFYISKLGGPHTPMYEFTSNNADYDFTITTNNHSFFFNDDIAFYDKIHGFDFNTNSDFSMSFDYNMTYNDLANDVIFADDHYYMAQNTGKISSFQGSPYPFRYNNHEREYLGIDFNGSYFIAIGIKTISSNFLGEWDDVMNIDGSEISETFYDVKILDQSTFFICGENGLFQKCSFE